MRFASLGSGSKGNATLIAQGETHILIDCGFSGREMERRLGRLGCDPDQLSAVVVTHEHSDHIKGLRVFSNKFSLPIYLSGGTHEAIVSLDETLVTIVEQNICFAIEDLEITVVPVPHDAKEPCQYVFSNGDKRLGVLTDTGCITGTIIEHFDACDALMIECNYDVEMLEGSDYPYFLKQRICGELGHLSNAQAAEFVAKINTQKLNHLVASHLSERNNTPALARQALARETGWLADDIAVIDQQDGLSWQVI